MASTRPGFARRRFHAPGWPGANAALGDGV